MTKTRKIERTMVFPAALFAAAGAAHAQNTTPASDTPPSAGLTGFSGANTVTKAPAVNATAEMLAEALRDPLKTAGKPGKGANIHVDPNQLVDLAVKDEDLSSVLEMLSIQSQRNIIASKDVNARVSANFFGVTFYQALDAILHANGYGYIEKDNFIYVYTAEQLQAIMTAQKTRQSKVINLNYINPIDAAEFVKAALSEGGQIKTNGKTINFPSKSDVPIGSDEFSGPATLVVTDYEENILAVLDLIKQLDVRPAQVQVEATILQASLNESNAFGVDFALLSDINFSDFVGVGGGLKAVDALAANNSEKLSGGSSGDTPAAGSKNKGGAITSSPGNINGPATMKFGYINNDVGVFLRVLDEVTDTTVLSNPKLLVLNRQPARVLVGQRVGYLNTTSTDTATTQTVEFLDTGTQLHVRPFVSDDGIIRLELKPQVSTAVVRDVKNSSGAVVTVPDEITNELTTNVMVRDGQTVVLGGLFREKTQSTRRQVPVLGDIPILGEAFRGHDDAVQRDEIIFLITPTIVNDQILGTQGKKSLDKLDQVRSGSRQNLLGFSREKRSGSLLVEAQRLAESGDTQKALWKIEQSLTLNPLQPDALMLKEKLSGTKAVWPNRSMLEEMIRKEQNLPAPKTDAESAEPASDTTQASATIGHAEVVVENSTSDGLNSTAEAPKPETALVTPSEPTGGEASPNELANTQPIIPDPSANVPLSVTQATPEATAWNVEVKSDGATTLDMSGPAIVPDVSIDPMSDFVFGEASSPNATTDALTGIIAEITSSTSPTSTPTSTPTVNLEPSPTESLSSMTPEQAEAFKQYLNIVFAYLTGVQPFASSGTKVANVQERPETEALQVQPEVIPEPTTK